MLEIFRLAVVAALMAIGPGVAVAQDDRARVIGVLSDPAGVNLPGVEVQLTGLDVAPKYSARTDDEGRYEFTRVVPGAYRVEVRQSMFVATPGAIKVMAGEFLRTKTHTALRAQVAMSISAASAEALRRWAAGGPPPATPIEWECVVNGRPCDVPTRVSETLIEPWLVPPPLGDVLIGAVIALHGAVGIVEISGAIAADGGGFMSSLSVNSASSPELAAAALAELGRMRWEQARLRGVAVNTSVTMEIRF